MRWNEIREAHPDRWIVAEVLRSHIAAGKAVLEDLAVVRLCQDGSEAFDAYRALRREHSLKELVYLHTSNEELDIDVRFWAGVRVE
jgi:hypothetical protein